MLTGVDVLQTSVQLLSDTSQYALDPDRAASVNTNSMTISMVASMGMLLAGGIFYDLLGRKTTIAMMFLLGALTCFPIPYGKNVSYPILYFTIFKVVFNSSFVPLTMNPLINDYVVVQDRGLANGL